MKLLSTIGIIYVALYLFTWAGIANACGEDSYTTNPLPPTPKFIVMDYPRSERAEVFAERVAAMRLWVASNTE